jgi:hypothetical protein
MGWGWRSVHDPKQLPQVLEKWNFSIHNGKPFEMVFPLLGADGSLPDFLTLALPVRDVHGKIVRSFGSNTDITEQRRSVLPGEGPRPLGRTQNGQNSCYRSSLRIAKLSFSPVRLPLWIYSTPPINKATIFKLSRNRSSLKFCSPWSTTSCLRGTSNAPLLSTILPCAAEPRKSSFA